MSLRIPTTQELSDQNLAGLEGALGQNSPVADKSFLRVLAAVEALTATGMYKLAIERIKQVLAMTATGSDLDLLGAEYSTPRTAAEAARLTVTLPALTGTIIPSTAGFTGAANGVRYFMESSAEAFSNVATCTVIAEDVGTAGNLAVSDTLTIISPIAGAESVATVTVVENTGAEEETDTAYRPRVLFAMRATTGGSNATDHKIWAEEVAGVLRAFPYGGRPVGEGTSYPGDRSVYVECDSTLDADGIPDAGLLAEVRTALTTDPVTSLGRSALGMTDTTLWVEPITRTSVVVTVTGLVTPSGQIATVKAAIEDALDLYFAAALPFITGVDLTQDRNDTITDVALAEVVQGVLAANGSSATAVGSDLAATYTLGTGELVKMGSIVYA
jgi:uncharacterized phage protein gp47/JayE